MNKLFKLLLASCVLWITFALSFQTYMGYLTVTNQQQEVRRITGWLDDHLRNRS